MNVEEAVSAVTEGADKLLSCLGQPFVAYHLTKIMREADVDHAHEMQQEFLERNVEALVLEGLEDDDAERVAQLLDQRVESAWMRLHTGDPASLGQA
jgi:hypothetical protein